MAGDWIKMRVDLADDPAVAIIADITGIEPDAVVGKLHRLWSWADRHTTNGNARVTLAWLNRYVGVDQFAQAMQESGWLECDNGNISIPKFSRHNGKSGKKRANSAKRQAAYRLRHSNAKVTKRALPREEKSREEKSISLPTEERTPTPLELPENLNNQPFRDAFARWLAYKKERRESYKPTGLAGVLSAASSKAERFGVDAVIEAMGTAIANGWQGWDQKSLFGANNGNQASRVTAGQRFRRS